MMSKRKEKYGRKVSRCSQCGLTKFMKDMVDPYLCKECHEKQKEGH